MAAVVVVADDLTGANATGARYASRGLRTATVGTVGQLPAFAERFDVVAVTTDSRHVDAQEAADRVGRAVRAAGSVGLVVKRIDTTLRGNVGAETDAALDRVAARVGTPVRALVVPAFPTSGRTTVGGIQLVGGQALTDTEAANDPLSPVPSSRVTEVIAAQSSRSAAEVHLDVVAVGGAALADALAAPEQLLVCDALTDAHLRHIAAAAATVTDVTWVSVDPGPFGVELAAALALTTPAGGGLAALVVAGSTTHLTRAQLDVATRQLDAAFVDIDVRRIDTAAVAEQVAALAADAGEGVVGLRTAARDGDVLDLDATQAARIPRALGEITARVLSAGGVGGLYLTGGDVVAGLIAALDADGLEIEEEVLPLAVAGRLVGGPHAGLPVVTKGGLIGDEAAAVACLEHLRGRIRKRRRTVETAPMGERT